MAHISAELTDGLLRIRMTDTNGQPQELMLFLHTGREAGL